MEGVDTMSRYKAFKSAFKTLTNHDMTTATLSDRIIVQKIAYLIQKKDIDLGYSDFSWYIHGVFSWDLWYGAIAVEHDKLEFDEEKINSLEKLKNEFEESGVSDYFDSSDNLELITTILFYANSQDDLIETNESLISKVKKAKTKFTEEEIKSAIGKLKKVNWNF